MTELRGERADKHDADAPLTRESTSWFARELNEEWQEVEPGIFRHVGPRRLDNHETSQANAVPEVELLKRKGLKRVTDTLLDKGRRSPG
jgi:hypothetical protein